MQKLEFAHKNGIIGPSGTRTTNIVLFYKKYLFVKINVCNKHLVHKAKNLINVQGFFSKYYGAHYFRPASIITAESKNFLIMGKSARW